MSGASFFVILLMSDGRVPARFPSRISTPFHHGVGIDEGGEGLITGTNLLPLYHTKVVASGREGE